MLCLLQALLSLLLLLRSARSPFPLLYSPAKLHPAADCGLWRTLPKTRRTDFSYAVREDDVVPVNEEGPSQRANVWRSVQPKQLKCETTPVLFWLHPAKLGPRSWRPL